MYRKEPERTTEKNNKDGFAKCGTAEAANKRTNNTLTATPHTEAESTEDHAIKTDGKTGKAPGCMDRKEPERTDEKEPGFTERGAATKECATGTIHSNNPESESNEWHVIKSNGKGPGRMNVKEPGCTSGGASNKPIGMPSGKKLKGDKNIGINTNAGLDGTVPGRMNPKEPGYANQGTLNGTSGMDQ